MPQKLKSLDTTAVTPEARSAHAVARRTLAAGAAANANTHPPLPSIPTPPTSPSSPAPFLRFLNELHPLIQPNFDPTSPSTTPSRLQAKVLSNPDYFLPFRERAPSRLRILHSPSGPFSGKHMGNRRGVLFSALVFRGITFATDALHTSGHSGFFADIREWEEFHISAAAEVSGEEERERWFCNPCPYGRTHGRTTSNAPQFWAASAVLLAFLSDPDRNCYPTGPTFLDVVKHIASATHNRKTVYPTFGALVAYLVAADLAYAGEIPMPTVDEMGEVVEYIGKGAVGGLCALGLFYGKGKEPSGVGAAFRRVYGYLDAALTEAQKKEMGFDIFMVEHALCKVKRLSSLKAFVI